MQENFEPETTQEIPRMSHPKTAMKFGMDGIPYLQTLFSQIT